MGNGYVNSAEQCHSFVTEQLRVDSTLNSDLEIISSKSRKLITYSLMNNRLKRRLAKLLPRCKMVVMIPLQFRPGS